MTNANAGYPNAPLEGYDASGDRTVILQVDSTTVTTANGLTYGKLATSGTGGGGGGAIADTIATGNLTAAQPTAGTPVVGGTVSITLGNGQAVVEAQLIGTFSAGTTVLFEGTDDVGVTTNWFTTFGQDTTVANASYISSIVGGASRLIRIQAGSYQQIRVRCTPYTAADNVAVRLIGSVAGSGLGALSTNDGTFASHADMGTNHTDLTTLHTDLGTLATQATLAQIKTDVDKIPASPAQEGGNLATLVTNTADLLADGDHLATIDSGIASLVTNTADLLADGDQLATIQTNTANIPAKGTAVMTGSTPVTIATNDTVLSELLADTDNLASIKTDLDAIAPGVQGWIAATGTGTASQDNLLTFAQQVRKVVLYNASANNVPLEFDATAAATSIPISPGAFWVLDDILCTVVHVFPSATLPINTTSGLYVKGWK